MSWKSRAKALKRSRKEKAQNLQDWLTARKEASEERAKRDRAERLDQSRGVNRVPESVKDLGEHTYKPIIETTDANHDSRRQMGKVTRIRPVRVPRDTIFHEKDWQGNLTNTKVEVEGTKAPITKVESRSGENQTYVNPAKDRSLAGKARKRARRER